jgi:hypothetical protein
MDNVTDEVKEYILDLSERVRDVPENEGAVATLFSQELLPRTMDTVYYTYNGMSMKE